MSPREFLDSIMPNIEKYIIKNGYPHAILEGYEYMREVITLYAKQHNLIESTLVLMDRGHNEEAYVLARSILNNYFLIGYLLDDNENRNRLKEYQIQPYISERYFWNNVKTIMERPIIKELEEKGTVLPFTKEDVERIIDEMESKLTEAGFSPQKRPLSIIKLAENSDEKGLELYATCYADASKYEHSDITTLDIYKQPISEELLLDGVISESIPKDRIFMLDMNKTDESLKEKIYNMIIISYVQTFIKFMEVVTVKEPHLKAMFDEMKLLEISSRVMQFSEE